MKTLVHTSHNKAEEVITHAEEELMLAKLIRHGADRDLVQAQKTIEDLSGKLATGRLLKIGRLCGNPFV